MVFLFLFLFRVEGLLDKNSKKSNPKNQSIIFSTKGGKPILCRAYYRESKGVREREKEREKRARARGKE